ncbi:MAG: aminoacyl-tRNA hydrolase [Alphaproteobacteria bacterium]|nr:aminoacyl-tRNA hydrolase [Alphaproteobacteria bacterium]
MMLVVGLGNPGAEYAGHRHNIGFMAVDHLVRRHGFGAFKSKFQGHLAEGMIGDVKVLALKPQTYMHDSGRSVAAAAHFHKLKPEDVIVLHDELDLAPGKLRVKLGGGSAGHNGLRSIDAHLGPLYQRVRLGIGHPDDRDQVARYVLHDFAKAEAAWLGPLLEAVAEAFPLLSKGDAAGFMTRIALLAPAKTAPQPPD